MDVPFSQSNGFIESSQKIIKLLISVDLLEDVTSFSEGRLMEQAERGWAGNNGRMGWVGETTASSHQHRCRYRIVAIVVVVLSE